MDISVIICTHNPRPDYLARTLDALKNQTLPKVQWELLLIDNASKEPLAGQWDLSWHPYARHVRELELGLTPARLRGFKESSGEVLVAVDDDNVLMPDYLSNALEVMVIRPWIGAIGGNITGEFETPPERWAEIMFPSLAIMSVKQEQWAYSPGAGARGFAPVGAGLVIRRKVMQNYADLLARDPFRRSLGRTGNSLLSGEDTDIVLCACALGYAIGKFPQLQMTHLISSGRVQREYLLRLAEGLAFSDAIVRYIWDGEKPSLQVNQPCRAEKLFLAYVSFRRRIRGRKQPDFAAEIDAAARQGIAKACEILRSR